LPPEVRPDEPPLDEVHLTEVHLEEACPDKVRLVEVRPPEVRLPEVRSVEDRPAEFCPVEVCPLEIWMEDIGILVTPCVPALRSLLEQRNVLVVGHGTLPSLPDGADMFGRQTIVSDVLAIAK